MNPTLLLAAIRNVESNLSSVADESTNQEDFNEEVFVLAFDAAVDAGASEEEASAIADHVRETMGIHQ